MTLSESKKLVVILLLIVGHGCFLDILLNPSYWGDNFEIHFLRVRKSKNTQSIFNIFNIVFILLI